MTRKRLVILGGGFGGLDVARAIGRSRRAREHWDTVLVDKENFFQFNPLLPAVAVGAVETRHIVYPFREMARHRHIRFAKNKAIGIDLARREVRLHNELALGYDTLVVAVGSVTNYYGVPGAEQNSRPFKTLADAMRLRARVVELFEMAEQAESAVQRQRLLSFAIVGGGVTGVEVAAEITDMIRDTLMPRYPSLQIQDVTLTILEGGPRIVSNALPSHSDYVHRYLVRRGVTVRLNARVEALEPRALRLLGGERLEAFTILWTAGVQPPPLVRELPVQHERDGRVRVDAWLRAIASDGTPIPSLYVIGDSSSSTRDDGRLQPALAPTAIAMGTHVGRQLVAAATGASTAPFRFHDAGYIISLGKHSSVLELFGFKLSGKLAWLAWAAAYLVKMVGFRKQLEVGIDHVTHMFFTHDSSQILPRRSVLSDDELNLSLRPAGAIALAPAPASSGQEAQPAGRAPAGADRPHGS